MRIRLITISVILSSIFLPGIFGQQIMVAGIPSANFNYFAASQRNSNWCWAASLQMIFNYYGVGISQEDIVYRSYGVNQLGDLPNWTGSIEVITRNLNNWDVDRLGRLYTVSSSVFFGAPTPAYLIQELSARRPVLVGYQSGPGSAHAVVITAVTYIITPTGPWIQTIIVRDPWPSDNNIMNAGRVEYPGAFLASKMFVHWYIAIY